MQLPTLAFPADPLALALVPDPPAMEQEKARPLRRRSVLPVETSDSFDRRAQSLIVI